MTAHGPTPTPSLRLVGTAGPSPAPPAGATPRGPNRRHVILPRPGETFGRNGTGFFAAPVADWDRIFFRDAPDQASTGDAHPNPAPAAVGDENRPALLHGPADARWQLARWALGQLQGGRAALLTPQRRRRLLADGRRLGLRDFDSNLIIAVVQDAARRGEPLDAPAPRATLAIIRPAPTASRPGPHTRRRFHRLRLGLAFALLAAAFAGLWLTLLGA